ncbi:MAG: hypothetical protein HKP18_08995, partial [Acidimicrobiia bacterium]|nr:hypothetical protein [Acidimicrobiia bacterium]
MRFRLMVGLVVLLVAAGCSDGSGSPTTPVPVTTLPEVPNPPPPISVERAHVDFGDIRRLVGNWELVSFPGEPFAPRIPTLTFGYLRTNETGLTYQMYRDGLCRQRWGWYTLAGNEIRANTSGWNILIPDPCADDAEFRLLGSWLWQAETWSVEGELLTITSVDGVTGAFRRMAEFPDPQLTDDDGLETVAPRLHFVDDSGFLVRIQEQENSDDVHRSENVNWLAWAPEAAQGTSDRLGWRTELVVSPNSWDFYRNLRD